MYSRGDTILQNYRTRKKKGSGSVETERKEKSGKEGRGLTRGKCKTQGETCSTDTNTETSSVIKRDKDVWVGTLHH